MKKSVLQKASKSDLKMRDKITGDFCTFLESAEKHLVNKDKLDYIFYLVFSISGSFLLRELCEHQLDEIYAEIKGKKR